MLSIPSRACAKLDCQSSLQSLSSRKTVAPPSTRCCQRPWGILASRAQGRAARLLGPCRHARPEPGCGRAAHAARAALLQCLLVPPPQPPRCLALLGTAPRAQQVAPGTYRTFGFGLDGSFLVSISPTSVLIWTPFLPGVLAVDSEQLPLTHPAAQHRCTPGPVPSHPREPAWAGPVCPLRVQSRQAGLQADPCSAVGRRLRPCVSSSP